MTEQLGRAGIFHCLFPSWLSKDSPY